MLDSADPVQLRAGLELAEPLIPEALAHYFFAATANDSQSLVALGYRYLYGLNVERSCQTAALYYVAEAEHVITAAQQPGGLVPVLPCPCSPHLLPACCC